jgi:beta-galactosidase
VLSFFRTLLRLRTGALRPLLCLLVLLVAPGCSAASFSLRASDSARTLLPLDQDWLFTLGNPTNAQASDFDDQAWRHLNVPHDWSIEGPFDEENPIGGAGAFLPAGIGWYRRHFELGEADAQKKVFIDFDGVMANSDVWINGYHLGHRPNGYVSFQYDLSGHLNFGPGKTNVLALLADNSAQPASRWYSGAGIYRHVRLVVTDPIHFEHWSTFITAPEVSSNAAKIHFQTSITNETKRSREVMVVFEISGSSLSTPEVLQTKTQKLSPGQSIPFQADLILKMPRLWELAAPNLYSATALLKSGSNTLDAESIPLGIRDAHFEADTGFWLNGKNIKIKGVCLHHDCGALGAAVPLRAWERRLELLKQLGCNAIRTAHNPPAPEFLALCDRLGLLVMDEMFDCWTVGKNRYDYHLSFDEWSKNDTRDTVRRDRNHPSIIVYSAGNEIHDTPKAELANRILRGLVGVFHENDPTRPVSQALFRPNVSHDYDNGLADLLDVVGQNYRENEILAAHEARPARKILGTENGHDRKVWLALRDHPPYAGQFLWSGIDYLGETRRWPLIGAGSGLLDRTGTPRPRAWQRQSWWSDVPMVRIARRVAPDRSTNTEPGGFDVLARAQQEFCDWTPGNLKPHDEDVEIYSNCEQVELFLNNKSLGVKSLPADASPRSWTVPFAPGTLSAFGRNKGQKVASDELRTADKPAKIRLTVDRPLLTPSWDDLAYVEALVVDQNNVLVPTAADTISFASSSPGFITAVDNGNNASHEPFHASARRAYQGRCFALVQAKFNGFETNAAASDITVEASAPGLAAASVAIKVNAR